MIYMIPVAINFLLIILAMLFAIYKIPANRKEIKENGANFLNIGSLSCLYGMLGVGMIGVLIHAYVLIIVVLHMIGN